jgi:hypothetical protein
MVNDSLVRRAIQAAAARAAAQVEANMTSTVIITRPAQLALEPDGDLTATIGATVYSGWARVGKAQGPVTYTLGDEVQFYSSGTCTIPLTVSGLPTDPHVNDLLEVTGSADPVMVGRRFRVVDVEAVSIVPDGRRMQLVGIQRYPGWEDDVVRHPAAGGVPDEIPPEWQV